jgi:hypothetical protein
MKHLSDQREDLPVRAYPDRYKSHEVTSPRAVGPSGRAHLLRFKRNTENSNS